MSDFQLPRFGAQDDQWAEGPGLFASIWRYRWLVAALTLLAGLAGYGLSMLQPVTYQTSATLFMADPRNANVFQGTRVYTEPEEFIPQQAARVTSGPVLEAASTLLNGSVTPGELRRFIDVDGEAELLEIDITATSQNPAQAAAAANAVAQAFQNVAAESNQSAALQAAEELQPTLDAQQTAIEEAQRALAVNPDDVAQQARLEALQNEMLELQTTARQLQIDAAVYGSGVELVEEAGVPDEPASPQPTRNALVLAVLGAAVGCAFAYWQAGREQKADDANAAAVVLRAPLLGQVPEYRVDERGAVTGQLSPSPEAAEAYHIVLQSLEFALQEVGGSSLLVTSVAPGDGKTLTAMQLSLAAARDGRRVVLVDGDVRMRGLSKLLGLQRNPGLTELSVQDLDVEDCLRTVPLAEHLELPVLPAGGRLEETTSFFRGFGFRKAMAAVRTRADMVVVDSPPLLAVADSSVMAAHVDGLVLVVTRGTPLEQLAQVRQRLDFVSTPLLGYIFNRSDSSMTPYYGESAGDEGRRRRREPARPPRQVASAPGNGQRPRRQEPAPVGSRVERLR